MAAPGPVLQVCAIVSYFQGFANANNTPNIGVYAMVDPVDASSSGIKMRVERCTGTGCTSFTLRGNSNGVQFAASPAPQAEFLDSGAYATIYRYRVRLENDDGNGPFAAIEIDTTINGTSVCDTGAITDFTDQLNSTGLREIVESELTQVQATGLSETFEHQLTQVQSTGLREVVEHTLAQVQATGLRIVLEYIEAAVVDLNIVKTADNPTPFPGDTVTWTAVVTNAGATDATNVIVNDVLPSGVIYVSHTTSQGLYDPMTGVWVVGNLASGATATLTIVTTAGLIGPEPCDEEVCNTVTVTSDGTELTPLDNTDTECIVIQPPVPPVAHCPPENPPPIPPIPPGECPPRTPPDVLNYSVPFRLYQKDFEVRLKSWGDDTAYALVRPQGGPSFERGAQI